MSLRCLRQLQRRRHGGRSASAPSPPPTRTVPLNLYRNDGLTGASRFSAGVPMAAGWVTAAQLGTVALWIGGVEVPCYVEALKGRAWPDGRTGIRGLLLQADLTWATANTPVAAELRLGPTAMAPRLAKDTTVPAWMPNPVSYSVDSADDRFFRWDNTTYHLIGPATNTPGDPVRIVRVAAGTRVQWSSAYTIAPGGGLTGAANSFTSVCVDGTGTPVIGGASGGGPDALGGQYPPERIAYAGTCGLNRKSTATGNWVAGTGSLNDPDMVFHIGGVDCGKTGNIYLNSSFDGEAFTLPPYLALPTVLSDRLAMGEVLFGRTVSEADESALGGTDKVSSGAYEQGRAWLAAGWRKPDSDLGVVLAFTLRALGTVGWWTVRQQAVVAQYGYGTGSLTPEWNWQVSGVKCAYYLSGHDDWRQWARTYVSGYCQRTASSGTYLSDFGSPTAYWMEARVRARVLSGFEVCTTLEADPNPTPPVVAGKQTPITDWLVQGRQIVAGARTSVWPITGDFATWRTNASCLSTDGTNPIQKAYMGFMVCAALVDWYRNVEQDANVLPAVRGYVDWVKTNEYDAGRFGDQYMTPMAQAGCFDGTGGDVLHSMVGMGCKPVGFVFQELQRTNDPAAAAYKTHGDERYSIYWQARDTLGGSATVTVTGFPPKSWVEPWQDQFEYLADRLTPAGG